MSTTHRTSRPPEPAQAIFESAPDPWSAREEAPPGASPYRGLLVILAFAVVALLVHGAFGEEVPLGFMTLAPPDLGFKPSLGEEAGPTARRQLAIASTPNPREPQVASRVAGAAVAVAASASNPVGVDDAGVDAAGAAREVDRGPQRILLLGDSMVDVLKDRLADYCQKSGHRLFPAVWYASTTASWAQGRELEDLLREVKPTLVLVSLGSSELTVQRVDQRERYVRAMVKRIGPRELLWIGPPNWRADTGINALIARVLGPERFFRSGVLDLDRGPDGIHPNTIGGAKWADAIVRWIGEESAHPIVLLPPTRPAPRVAAVHVYPPP